MNTPFFRRIYKSTAFSVTLSFLFLVFVFTVFEEPIKSHSSDAAVFWFSLITRGLPAGLFVAMLSRMRIKSYGATLGIKQEQLPLLKKAVETGVLPEDKKLRAALPGYMYAQYTWSKPRNKRIALILAVIFGINFLGNIGERNTLKIVVDILMVVAVAVTYVSVQKKTATVASFYEQLGVDPETAKPVMPKMEFKMPTVWSMALVYEAKLLITFASAVLGTALISVAIGEGIISPWVIAPLFA